MEEASKMLRSFKQVLGDNFISNVDLNQPGILGVFTLSGMITVLAIYLAWFFTRSKESEESPDEKDAQPVDLRTDFETEPLLQRCPFSSLAKAGENTEHTDESSNTWSCEDRDEPRPTPEGWESLQDQTDVDPKEYCDHIQSQFKRSKHRIAIKEIEQELSPEQRVSESELQGQQLQAIFKMMEEQKDKFGVDDMGEMKDQMKLYM